MKFLVSFWFLFSSFLYAGECFEFKVDKSQSVKLSFIKSRIKLLADSDFENDGCVNLFQVGSSASKPFSSHAQLCRLKNEFVFSNKKPWKVENMMIRVANHSSSNGMNAYYQDQSIK